MQSIVIVVLWYVATQAISWSLLPTIMNLVPKRLRWKSVGIVKVVAFYAASISLWAIQRSIHGHTLSVAFIWILLIAGIGFGVYKCRNSVVFAESWRYVGVVEASIFIAFVIYLCFRWRSPGIYHTEQPMDFAILNSLSVNASPSDPWLAGNDINYYYIGYIPYSVLSNAAGIDIEFGYWLSIATLVGLATGVFVSIGLLLSEGFQSRLACWVSSALGIALGLLSGNWNAHKKLVSAAWSIDESSGWWSADGVGWSTTRVITDVTPDGREAVMINEYPLFSLVLGDLHPHVIAIPLNLAFIGVSILIWKTLRGRKSVGLAKLSGLLGMSASFVAITNPWDAPLNLTIAGILLGSLLITSRIDLRSLLVFVVSFSVPIAWFVKSYDFPSLPQQATNAPFQLPVAQATNVAQSLTSISEGIQVWGIHLSLIIMLFAYISWPTILTRLIIDIKMALFLLFAVVVILGIIHILNNFLTVVVALILVVIAMFCSLLNSICNVGRPILEYTSFLLLFGFIAMLIPEVIYIPDLFDSRMNTVFKFHYQGWVILTVAVMGLAAVSVENLKQNCTSRTKGFAVLAPLVIVLTLLASSAPIVAGEYLRAALPSQSGLSALSHLPKSEREAIEWIKVNIPTDSVILETTGCSYRPLGSMQTSRVATFTGRPGVLGWIGHERQWRVGQPKGMAEIDSRQLDVQSLFSEPDRGDIAAKYGIDYFYVGEFEVSGVGDECSSSPSSETLIEDLERSSCWSSVYENHSVVIFRFEVGSCDLYGLVRPDGSLVAVPSKMRVTHSLGRCQSSLL